MQNENRSMNSVTRDTIILGTVLAVLVIISVHGNHVMLTSDFFVTPYDLWAEPGIGYNVEGGFFLH